MLAAVAAGALAISSLSLSGMVGSAAVEELMNDTFESGYGAWKALARLCHFPQSSLTAAERHCIAMTVLLTGAHRGAL